MRRLLLFFLTTSVFLGCTSDRSENTADKKAAATEQALAGQPEKTNAFLRLELVQRTRLQTDGEGFIQRFATIRYKDNRFYSLDGATSDILVFSRNGEYLKKVKLEYQEDNYTGFPNFEFGPDGHFFIRSAKYKDSKIIEADTSGRTIRIYSTHLSENRDKAESGPSGFSVIKTKKGKRIFSSSFQWIPLRIIIDSTRTIAAFNEDGVLTNLFARFHPDYVKYNLDIWRDTDITVYGDFIYNIQAGLPYIEVYDFSGKLIKSFGRAGEYQHPITKMPESIVANINARSAFWRKHTTYSRIRVVSSEEIPEPLVAVSYFNPAAKPVAGLQHFQKLHDNYLQLYRLSGEPYHPDIKLPGRFHDFTEDGHLLLIENLILSELTVGLYKLTRIQENN